MWIMSRRKLSQVHKEATRQELERSITDFEIASIEQERELTEHEIAIEELKEKMMEVNGNGTE